MQKNSIAKDIIVAVAGAAVGAVVTALITNNLMVTNYVSLNSLDTLLQTHFVQAGLVDDSVLALDANEQMEYIAKAMTDQKKDEIDSKEVVQQLSDQLSLDVEEADFLTTLQSISEAVTALQEEKSGWETDRNNADAEKADLVQQIAEKDAQIADLKQRPSAEVLDTGLIIDGENIADTLSGGVAQIDGNAYYAESMLETYFLDQDLRYDPDGNHIVYGNEKPEKVRFAPKMVSNEENINSYNATFSMATDEYSNGIRTTHTYSADSYMQIVLKEQYSKCSFTIGHVDGADMYDATIVFYGKDEYGEFTVELGTIKLSPSMSPQSYEVPLNYRSDVKVWMSHSFYCYGMTDFYFYR